MALSRRDWLKAGLLAGTGAVLGGCSLVTRSANLDGDSKPSEATDIETTLLERIGFGPDATTVRRLQSLGPTAFIEEQLNASQPNPIALEAQLHQLDVLQLEPSDLWDIPQPRVMLQLQQAAILRAVYSPNQLRERMVDFWSNHFNIYIRKGNTAFSKSIQETNVIREHSLGSFEDMLVGIAHSPAMLEFLDNDKNSGGVANENYARELMELHTLGLHGGYTQRDVQEVARCFTGWTIEDRFLHAKGTFRFNPERHDDGSKEVLGTTIGHGGGEHDGQAVLRMLARHPSTAQFLTRKLCIHFLGASDPSLEGLMAAAYLTSGTDIKSTLRPLLQSQKILTSRAFLKRPFDYMVSVLRRSGSSTDGGTDLQAHLERMGEPLYQWPMPDGYPERATAWTSSLLPRWNFALDLVKSSIPGTAVGEAPYIPKPRLAPQLSDLTPKQSALALALCAPEVQMR